MAHVKGDIYYLYIFVKISVLEIKFTDIKD